MTGSDSKIPSWLETFVNPQDLQRIEEAITRAEVDTSVEIVPMIVSRSSHIGHVPWMLGLLLLLFILVPMASISQVETWVWACVVLVIPAALFGGRMHRLARFFVTKEDQAHQVHARAEVEFHRVLQNLESQRHPGVLIFVSLLERKVVVLADPRVSAKLASSTWQNLIQHFLPHFRSHDLGKGFEEAILECGRVLKERFPAPVGGHGANEVPNELVVRE